MGAHAAQVQQVRSDIGELNERVKGLETESLATEGAIDELKATIAAKNAEAQREVRRKEKLEVSLKEFKATVEQRHGEIKQRQNRVNAGIDETGKAEMGLREQKQAAGPLLHSNRCMHVAYRAACARL